MPSQALFFDSSNNCMPFVFFVVAAQTPTHIFVYPLFIFRVVVGFTKDFMSLFIVLLLRRYLFSFTYVCVVVFRLFLFA